MNNQLHPFLPLLKKLQTSIPKIQDLQFLEKKCKKIADEAAERSKLRPSPLSSPSQRVGDSITDLLISLNWGIFSTDPVIPSTAKEASLMGLEQAEGVSFTDQVKGNAKLFAGKFTGNDEEVKLGAAK